jgi:5-methylcytosine-specific restriction endonuclease McrA
MIKLTRRPLPGEVAVQLTERAVRLRQHLLAGDDPPQALLNFYRNPELKQILVAEANGKCMYCESKITHVYFGDVEHIRPKSRFPEARLDHDNLGLACAICNNAKGEFWDDDTPLLNPFNDDPDEEVLALGTLVVRRPGRSRARLTIQQMDLNRTALLERRKERIELLASLADQYVQAPAGAIKDLLKDELCRHAADDGEYALIVRAYLEAACGLQCN